MKKIDNKTIWKCIMILLYTLLAINFIQFFTSEFFLSNTKTIVVIIIISVYLVFIAKLIIGTYIESKRSKKSPTNMTEKYNNFTHEYAKEYGFTPIIETSKGFVANHFNNDFSILCVFKDNVFDIRIFEENDPHFILSDKIKTESEFDILMQTLNITKTK